jgi:hypothetical protein
MKEQPYGYKGKSNPGRRTTAKTLRWVKSWCVQRTEGRGERPQCEGQEVSARRFAWRDESKG